MDRDIIMALVTIAATSGAAWWAANATRRRINREAESLGAKTDRLRDERTHMAMRDAHVADRRAIKWHDAFYQLWHWVQVHWAMYHHSDTVELPSRDQFVDDDDEVLT